MLMRLHSYLWALALAPAAFAQAAPVDFQRDVQPVLEKNCIGCHNPKLRMSGLSLASRRDAAAGGKRGPALPAAGTLLPAVKHEGNLRMPPGRKLSDTEIGILQQWIDTGAQWPANAIDATGAKPNHWSLRTPQRPALPAVERKQWVRNPIDSFVLARLEKEAIAPSRPADRRTLVRRLYLDLLGLLPTPADVESFENDQDPKAWERLTDQLLSSPHYGERWGRRWLDYARYADSDGGSRDEPRLIWRYRDWVINALNHDQPFDQFVVDQLAGDLVEKPTEAQLIATGFHRNSPLQIEAGTDREQYRVEMVFDRVDTTSTVFLGLSAGCAKCHDHKFDPISQREYYQMFAVFNNTDDYSSERPWFNLRVLNLHDVHAPYLPFSPAEAIAKRDSLTQQMLTLDARAEHLRALKTAEAKAEVKRVEAEIAALKKQLPVIDGTMITRELPTPRQTHIFNGGDYLSKGAAVQPGGIASLHPFPTTSKRPANRLDFARWLVDPANPLLARVTVNRIWQEYFGRGLVETENDFGTQGSPPTHPELLDWLATEFVSSGWSQKAIHRLIVTSAAYQQASALRPDLDERDPRNLLLARQTRLRLDAEIVRDAALSASGKLAPKVGGPSVFPLQPANVKKAYRPSPGEDRYRRGMYTFFWRVTPNPQLVVFDAPAAMTACTRRQRSNTPLQALTVLNEAAFHDLARALALRILREAPTAEQEARLRHAFRLTLARDPSPKESEAFRAFLAAERDALQTTPEDATLLAAGDAPPPGQDKLELASWISVARALMNTDEFLTRE